MGEPCIIRVPQPCIIRVSQPCMFIKRVLFVGKFSTSEMHSWAPRVLVRVVMYEFGIPTSDHTGLDHYPFTRVPQPCIFIIYKRVPFVGKFSNSEMHSWAPRYL